MHHVCQVEIETFVQRWISLKHLYFFPPFFFFPFLPAPPPLAVPVPPVAGVPFPDCVFSAVDAALSSSFISTSLDDDAAANVDGKGSPAMLAVMSLVNNSNRFRMMEERVLNLRHYRIKKWMRNPLK